MGKNERNCPQRDPLYFYTTVQCPTLYETVDSHHLLQSSLMPQKSLCPDEVLPKPTGKKDHLFSLRWYNLHTIKLPYLSIQFSVLTSTYVIPGNYYHKIQTVSTTLSLIPSSNPQPPGNHSSVSVTNVLPILEFQKTRITQYVPFSIWLPSLNVMFLR